MRNNVIFLALLCAIVVMFSGAVSAADVPSANFTSNVTSGAAPLSVQFTDTSNGAPTSWSWNFGDGNSSTDQNPVYTYKKAGTYNVILTATNDAGSNSLTQTNYITVLLNDAYVSPTGNDTTGDGTATNPYATIQNGLNNVVDGGTIHLQSGTYTGTGNKGITITKNVIITGEGQANTIIDAQGSGNIFTVNSGVNVTIANLTLANGTSTAGSAIYNTGNLTLINSTFTGNTATSTVSTSAGNICNKGTMTVNGCTFKSNTATLGAGIWNYATITSLNNCTFLNNTATGSGGACIFNRGTITSLSNCTFTNNIATTNFGGAIENYQATITSLSNCTFLNNTGRWGGAIYNYSSSTISLLSDSTFTNNTSTSTGYVYGGAIYNKGTITLSGCTFTGNTANTSSTYGGAIYSTGTTASITVNYSSFVNNTATSGSAIYCASGTVNAEYNWWGSNSNPSSQIGGTVDYNNWLYMTLTLVPSNIEKGGTGTVIVSFNNATDGTNVNPVDPSVGHIPDGTVVSFNSALGTFNPATAVTTNGTATTTFTATTMGSGGVNATTNSQTVSSPNTVSVYEVPVANFTATTVNGIQPLTVKFIDISSGMPTSWHWDFGDGSSSAEENPIHTYTVAGKYNVTLKAGNDYGNNTIVKSNFITVHAYAPPVANFTMDKNWGINNVTVQFKDTSVGQNINSWYWDFGDGSNSTGQNPTHTYNSVGNYAVTLTATSPEGSSTKTGSITVFDSSIPFSNFRGINIFVANDNGVKYDVENGSVASNTAGITYIYVPDTYFVNFRQDGGGLNPIHISTSNTDYQVTTTTNQSGTFWITFNGGQPTMPEAILMLAVNGTIPDDFALHLTSSGYTWDMCTPGIGNNDTTNNLTYVTGALNETFNKSDFIYDSYWKLNSGNQQDGTNAYLPIYYSGQNMGDTNNTFRIMFIDLDVGALNPSKVSGLINNGAIRIDYSFTDLESFAAFNVYGWYSASNHGTGIIMTNSLTTNPSGYSVYGVANFTANATSGNNTLAVQFADKSTNNPTSWSWDFGDGSTSVLQNPKHTYSKPGNYTVTLTTANINGNSTETKTDYITVLDTLAPVVNVNVPGGLYNGAQSVVLNATDVSNTKIYYTTDGSVPTTSSTFYTGPISISNTTTLKYIAVDAANNTSPVYSQGYTIDTVAPVLNVTPKGGSYNSPQRVVLAASEFSEIYYTLDGTTPTRNSAKYSGPISVKTSKKLNYTAWDAAGNQSQIYKQQYRIYKSVRYSYVVKDYYKKGWYKHYYYKTYKHWYRSHGKWKYYWKHKLAYKWKYGWVYRYVTKHATKNVLT